MPLKVRVHLLHVLVQHHQLLLHLGHLGGGVLRPGFEQAAHGLFVRMLGPRRVLQHLSLQQLLLLPRRLLVGLHLVVRFLVLFNLVAHNCQLFVQLSGLVHRLVVFLLGRLFGLSLLAPGSVHESFQVDVGQGVPQAQSGVGLIQRGCAAGALSGHAAVEGRATHRLLRLVVLGLFELLLEHAVPRLLAAQLGPQYLHLVLKLDQFALFPVGAFVGGALQLLVAFPQLVCCGGRLDQSGPRRVEQLQASLRHRVHQRPALHALARHLPHQLAQRLGIRFLKLQHAL
mmetsp:Transcript_38304/g.73392  ORF Transcript_38304/g.73392 Transcript_38304/m.73392 type:complete len:286 (-) Transcript_38304:1175-2032(-)